MKKSISLLLVCLITISAFGQSTTETEVTGTDREALSKVVITTHQRLKTLSATFEQEKKSSLPTKNEVKKGNFYYQAPQQLRWEYKTPEAITIVIDGEINSIKTNKGTENNTDNVLISMGTMIMSVLNGSNFNDNKNFSVSYIFDKRTSKYNILLLPKNRKIKTLYKQLRVVLDGRNYLTDKIIMEETSGDITTISFINKKINSELPQNSFNLE